jgi:hypothetical protein
MRTCVNLHSAEIKFAAGTASFLREGLDFPHKKPSRNRAHATSAWDELSLGYPSPDIPRMGTTFAVEDQSGGRVVVSVSKGALDVS